jgi:adenylate kinase
MHSSMKSIELKMQLCTKNKSMYMSMKVSFMIVKVIWFHNKKKKKKMEKIVKYLKNLIFGSL